MQLQCDVASYWRLSWPLLADDVEAHHKANYNANMQNVAEVNAQNLGFELGENQFSDLNQDEYRVAAVTRHLRASMVCFTSGNTCTMVLSCQLRSTGSQPVPSTPSRIRCWS